MKYSYLTYYIIEIKIRIIYLLVGIIFEFLILFIYKNKLMYFIHYNYSSLEWEYIITSVPELLIIYYNIIIIVILLTLVYLVMFNLYLFFLPGLYVLEISNIIKVVRYIIPYSLGVAIIVIYAVNPLLIVSFTNLFEDFTVIDIKPQLNLFENTKLLINYYSIILATTILYASFNSLCIILKIQFNVTLKFRLISIVVIILIISLLFPFDLIFQLYLSIIAIIMHELTIINLLLYDIYNSNINEYNKSNTS